MFASRYSGQCSICGARILVGQHMTFAARRWVHTLCEMHRRNSANPGTNASLSRVVVTADTDFSLGTKRARELV